MAKYWKSSFSIRPSSEYSGFISFRIDWLDSHGGKELPEWKEITIGFRTWEFKKSQQRSQSCFWRFCRVGSFSDLWRLLSRPFSSAQFSHSVMSDSLWPHEPQHARPPCPSSPPGVYSNSCWLSQWCHLTISSSVLPFSSCPQSFPTSESFPMSQLFTWGGQSIGVSASTSVLPMNTQD